MFIHKKQVVAVLTDTDGDKSVRVEEILEDIFDTYYGMWIGDTLDHYWNGAVGRVQFFIDGMMGEEYTIG